MRGVELCVEALLDIEYACAIAGATPLQVFYATDYALLTFANMLSTEDDPPLVVSVSDSNDEVQQTGSSFMEAFSTAVMKLGAQGNTILFASGDRGKVETLRLWKFLPSGIPGKLALRHQGR